LPKRHASLYLSVALAVLLRIPQMVPAGHQHGGRSAADGSEAGSAEDDYALVERLVAWADKIDAIADRNYFVFGELNIDGEVRGVEGALSLLDSARPGDLVIVPEANLREAQFWAKTCGQSEVELYAVSTLAEAVAAVAVDCTPGPGQNGGRCSTL
jgi:predicted ATPase with chaperone activity